MANTAFAGAPPEPHPAPARTVVLACSATKVLAARAAAFRLYDGPLWRTLRTYWCPGDPVRIYALSPRYGLVPAEQVIAAYDLELSSVVGQAVRGGRSEPVTAFDRVAGDARNVLAWIEARRSPEVFVAARARYRALIAQWETRAPDPGLRFATGGIGSQRQQLRAFLTAVPSERAA